MWTWRCDTCCIANIFLRTRCRLCADVKPLPTMALRARPIHVALAEAATAVPEYPPVTILTPYPPNRFIRKVQVQGELPVGYVVGWDFYTPIPSGWEDATDDIVARYGVTMVERESEPSW